MPRIDKLLAAANRRIYWMNAVDADYLARNELPIPVRVIIERDLQRYGDVAAVQGKTAIVEVRTSEVSDRPRKGDVFTVGAETLTVDSVLVSDGHVHRCVAL